MGEIADMMIDGTMCSECGVYIGPATGHPRSCSDCKPKSKKKKVQPFIKFQPVRDGQLCVREWMDQLTPLSGSLRCQAPAEYVLRNNTNGRTDHLCNKHFHHSAKSLRQRMRQNPNRNGYIYLEISTGKITEVTQESLKNLQK